MKHILRYLQSSQCNISQAKKQDILLDQMLVAYQQESCTIDSLDTLESSLRNQLYFPPKKVCEDFSLSLDAAILSLRSWLLAFSAVALFLLSLSFSNNFQGQSNFGLDEVLTYNSEGIAPDPLTLSGEQEYGR